MGSPTASLLHPLGCAGLARIQGGRGRTGLEDEDAWLTDHLDRLVLPAFAVNLWRVKIWSDCLYALQPFSFINANFKSIPEGIYEQKKGTVF